MVNLSLFVTAKDGVNGKDGEIDIVEFYPSGGVNKLTSNFAAGKNKAWKAKWNSLFTPLSYYEAKDPDWIKKYTSTAWIGTKSK